MGATNLGKFLGKLVLVIINVVWVNLGPLKQSATEIDQLGVIHGHDQVQELVICEAGA